MTPTATLSRYARNVFIDVAKERGLSFEEVVALYPDPSEETIEDLEDEVDTAEAKRRLANSDPSEYKTLDDLRAHLANRNDASRGCQTNTMTLTLELKPEVESLLRAVARERGVSLEAVVADRLNFSEDELEEFEDELDVAAARRARLEDDPNERYTLDDLRAHVANRTAV